jgi:short-subunit dehydrogenase
MARQQDVRGKVAIVTGASSGVGWQTAVRLGEAGVKLCITARRVEALERLRHQLEARGVECLVVPGDVTVQADVEQVVRECVTHFGRVDILVNDAAVQSYGFFDELPWEHLTRTFDINVFGFMRFARAVLPHFKERGSGHIINVQSMLSKGAAPLLAAYTASKHATLGWAKCLEMEWMGSGIHVSNVLVPSVSSNMFEHAPTMFGLAPKPVPPTYDTDVAARAVLRCALRPGKTVVPVFLGGRLLLWVDALLAPVGKALMSRFGARIQMKDEPIHRPEGNLFRPVPEGVGPYGSVPPTPVWKRVTATAGLAALAGGVVMGVAGLARAAR